ncbi:hypothetical protein PFICI_02948 [Pestalotiopsis fici W106-1]|uniref:Suppressor of anucleate metulae protein B n=1 Tax=Pestalotiopsis fici (strain W106-1 / CGMCC3.15140) TaxID=1229662 RepID=W3XFP0_PESFW|nr:uncharacterized protein PFICI_02948 [Pestalotiopsis fici W106-1]ETS84923.1 hypothetical protein PFICI_02948 [Pestalotiopsis fici W106-1]
MGEIWDDILSSNKEQEALAKAVEADKDRCITEHKLRHPHLCPECWPRVINRMRDRYLNSSTKEWFSGRRVFLQELDTMFAQAREKKATLDAIEQRIQAEKVDWVRDKLKSLGLASATDRPDTIKALLNGQEKPVPQLISELRTVFTNDKMDSEKLFEDFMARVSAATSPEAKIEIYVETLFQTKHDPEGAAKSQKYIDLVRNGTSVSEVITLMARDRQSQGDMKEQQQFYEKRKVELTRAKVANDAAKAKKAKVKQDKLKAAAAAAQEYDLPPCAKCEGVLDTQSLEFCPLCVTLNELYEIPECSSTYFCSDECWQSGILPHRAKAGHACAGGEGFRSAEDSEADMHAAGFCKECIHDHKVETYFCSLRCFDDNFQAHREIVHFPKRDTDGEIYEDEKDLAYTSSDRLHYRAKRIEDHWIPLDDAVREWANKLGARYNEQVPSTSKD